MDTKEFIDKIIKIMKDANEVFPGHYDEEHIKSLEKFNTSDNDRYLCATFSGVQQIVKDNNELKNAIINNDMTIFYSLLDESTVKKKKGKKSDENIELSTSELIKKIQEEDRLERERIEKRKLDEERQTLEFKKKMEEEASKATIQQMLSQDMESRNYNPFQSSSFGQGEQPLTYEQAVNLKLIDKSAVSREEYYQNLAMAQKNQPFPVKRGAHFGAPNGADFGSKILFGGVNTSTLHYQKSKPPGYNTPKVPLFHPYDPIGGERGGRTKSYGMATFPIAGRLPDECKKNVPENVLKLLGENVDFDFYFSTQDQPWVPEDKLLFRPHYYLHNQNTKKTNKAAVIDSEGEVLLRFGDYMFSSHEANVFTYKLTKVKDNVCSPNRCPVKWDYKKTKCVYSIVQGPPLTKPVVTMHWLLNDKDKDILLKEVVNKLDSNTQVKFEDIVSKLKSLQEQSIAGMTLPIETITNLFPKPGTRKPTNK